MELELIFYHLVYLETLVSSDTVDMVRELNPKLLVGFSGSFNNGMSSRRGRRNGDFLFWHISGIDTTYRLPNYLKLGADLLFKYRGFLTLS